MAIESNLFKNNGNPVDTCHDVDFNTVLGLDSNSGTITSWQLGTGQENMISNDSTPQQSVIPTSSAQGNAIQHTEQAKFDLERVISITTLLPSVNGGISVSSERDSKQSTCMKFGPQPSGKSLILCSQCGRTIASKNKTRTLVSHLAQHMNILPGCLKDRDLSKETKNAVHKLEEIWCARLPGMRHEAHAMWNAEQANQEMEKFLCWNENDLFKIKAYKLIKANIVENTVTRHTFELLEDGMIYFTCSKLNCQNELVTLESCKVPGLVRNYFQVKETNYA